MSRATSPAAARMPTWRMPPPIRFRSTRARATRSADPASSEPTGAPRPFDRHDVTVATPADRWARVVPVATEALNSRAPSRWTGTPTATTAASRSRGQGRPPEARWVSSTQTAAGRGQRCSAPATSQATSSGSSVPSASSTTCSWAAWLTPNAAALVAHDVLAAPGDDQRAGGGQHPEGDLVGHRAGGHEHGRGLAGERGVAVLQPEDRGVVAEAVVADLGVGHGGAHGRGRAGDGVAPQVDGGRGGNAEGHRAHGTVGQ